MMMVERVQVECTFCGFGPRPLEVEVDESAGGSNQGKMYWAQNVEYFLSSTRPD